MTTIEYSLFRVKFIKPVQRTFFGREAYSLTPSELLLDSIAGRPKAEIRPGHVWHIGNVTMFSKENGYFAIGRTTTATIEKFDETSGDFTEEEQETSPYTHCVFNAKIGIIGIAKKAALAPTTMGISTKLLMLLSKVPFIESANIEVQIPPIPDPNDFLAAIDKAWQVSKFSATFRGPNPFDADEHFQKPLAEYLNQANGDKGKAEIQGEDLNKEVVKEVAKSTAATGNKASARIRKSESSKQITVKMKEEPIRRVYDEAEHDPKKVIADLTKEYDGVRSNV